MARADGHIANGHIANGHIADTDITPGEPMGRERLDVEALREFLRRRPQAPPGDRCGLCATPVVDAHHHVVDLDEGGVQCACRACGLLMEGGGERFAAIPQRVLHDPEVHLDDDAWASLGIPVMCAFIVVRRRADHPIAIHPSPGGPTEAPVDVAAWAAVVLENPWMATAEHDVEAVLLIDRSGPHGRREAMLVPIDRCYAMVGIVRGRWRGFDGGPEVWEGITSMLEQLRSDAVLLAR